LSKTSKRKFAHDEDDADDERKAPPKKDRSISPVKKEKINKKEKDIKKRPS
jgi:hypothetical protein